MGLFGNKNDGNRSWDKFMPGTVASIPAMAGAGDPSQYAPQVGAGPRSRGGIGGFFGRIGQRFGDRARSGELPLRIMAAQAIASGDQATAARIMAGLQEQQGQRQRAAAIDARRQSVFNNLVKQGMDPADAELAMTNPEALGTEFNTRFRTREASAGESIYRPGFDRTEPPQVWTAPTQPEQDAETLGLQPGTPQFNRFVQDRTLGAQGPTGVEVARDRIGATIRGQDLTNARGIRGQDLSDARGRRGQDLSDARGRRGQDMRPNRGADSWIPRATGGRGAGNGPIIRNPQTGQRMQLRAGQWVPLG